MEKLKTGIEKYRENKGFFKIDGLFRKFFAVYLASGAGYFIYKAAFYKGEPSEILLLTVGFVTGTVITTLVNFYYGDSQASQDKDIKKP